MQIENISMFIGKIVQPTGLPLWSFILLFAIAIILFYFYIIKFPITIVRLKNDVVRQSEAIKELEKTFKSYYYKVPNYKWKK